MRIGLINQLHGRPGAESPAPTWDSILGRARVAEEVGFDNFVFEDALLYRGEDATNGLWESVSIAAALAAVTSRIRLGRSVINSPYRSPAMTASIATTIDEISGGRYIFGIGAGNTPDSDYLAFGFPTDHRYSRFAEAIQIIHSLLKTGHADFKGQFYDVEQAELVLRGPHAQGPADQHRRRRSEDARSRRQIRRRLELVGLGRDPGPDQGAHEASHPAVGRDL